MPSISLWKNTFTDTNNSAPKGINNVNAGNHKKTFAKNKRSLHTLRPTGATQTESRHGTNTLQSSTRLGERVTYTLAKIKSLLR